MNNFRLSIPGIFIMIVAVLLLPGCHRNSADPIPEPDGGKVFMTIDVDPALPGVPQAWVYATDDNGNVLDIQQNMGGQFTLKSDSLLPDSVTLTFFYAYPEDQDDDTYILRTFAGVPINSTITANGDPTFNYLADLVEKGTASLTVQNVPGLITFSDGTIPWAGDFANNESHADLHLFTENPDVLAVGNFGPSQYMWFHDVKPGDQLVEDFANFTAFPKTVTFSGVAYLSGHVTGFTPANLSYAMGSAYGLSDAEPVTLEIGYMDGFEFYEESLVSNKPDGDLSNIIAYYKRGTLNPSVSLPTSDLIITNRTFANFDFTISNDFDFKHTRWQYDSNSGITWNVYSIGKKIPKLFDLPSTLKSKYPNFDISKFYHSQTDLYKSLDGYAYPDLIVDVLNTTITRDKEYFSYTSN